MSASCAESSRYNPIRKPPALKGDTTKRLRITPELMVCCAPSLTGVGGRGVSDPVMSFALGPFVLAE
jgi:hypothetical protein